jgi:hypothetical protein
METEYFQLAGNPAFMPFDDRGTAKLAIQVGTDWIDAEETELFGHSDSNLDVWGISASRADLQNGLNRSLKPSIRFDPPLGDSVYATFFATVGHRVDEIEIWLMGNDRVRISAMLVDVTEETMDANTRLTVDTALTETEAVEPPF